MSTPAETSKCIKRPSGISRRSVFRAIGSSALFGIPRAIVFPVTRHMEFRAVRNSARIVFRVTRSSALFRIPRRNEFRAAWGSAPSRVLRCREFHAEGSSALKAVRCPVIELFRAGYSAPELFRA